jgi:hypothetical protein
MILEARLGFIILFLLFWSTIGIVPWTVSAIASRGRGALLLLPIVVLSAIAAGFIVPITGARGLTGFWISLLTALVGATIAAAAGAALVRRLHAERSTLDMPLARPERRDEQASGEELSPKP